MSSAEIADEPPGTTECPYVEVGQKSRAQGADQNPAKRMRSEDAAGPAGGGTGKFFFGTMGTCFCFFVSSANKHIFFINIINVFFRRCK
jgi:hypothetical protein